MAGGYVDAGPTKHTLREKISLSLWLLVWYLFGCLFGYMWIIEGHILRAIAVITVLVEFAILHIWWLLPNKKKEEKNEEN